MSNDKIKLLELELDVAKKKEASINQEQSQAYYRVRRLSKEIAKEIYNYHKAKEGNDNLIRNLEDKEFLHLPDRGKDYDLVFSKELNDVEVLIYLDLGDYRPDPPTISLINKGYSWSPRSLKSLHSILSELDEIGFLKGE